MTYARPARRALSRRGFIYGGLALGISLAGCSRAETPASEPKQPATSGADATELRTMIIYKDPSCGCCEAWAGIAERAGYEVTLLDNPDMAAVKRRLGVPPELASCHTAQIGEYVVEGHVPLDQVDRLLRERPADVVGIAVPGMPLGSPGMEVPDGSTEPFQVVAFYKNGRTVIFRP